MATTIYNYHGEEIPIDTFGRYIKSINHRGYQTIAPENTLPAFKLSKEKGFDCVESDVRFTSDGIPVMLHNASINATARNIDGSQIQSTVNIADIQYDRVLRYDFGIWKSSKYKGTKIPTFEEFLWLCKIIGLHPYIELKTGTQAQLEGLVDIVHKYGMQKHVTWASLIKTYLNYVANYDDKARLDWFTSAITNDDVTFATSLMNGKREVVIGTGLTNDETILQSAINSGITMECGLIANEAQALAIHPCMQGAMSDSIVASKVLYDSVMSI